MALRYCFLCGRPRSNLKTDNLLASSTHLIVAAHNDMLDLYVYVQEWRKESDGEVGAVR